MVLVCVETDDAGPGRMPLDGRMFDRGRGAFNSPSDEARGFDVVDVAHATLTPGNNHQIVTIVYST